MTADTPLYVLRDAARDDVLNVLALFTKNLWPIAHFPPEELTVMADIFKAVGENRVIVIERDKELIGAAKWFIGREWYTSKNFVYEHGFCVAENYRKSLATAKLFRALRDKAASFNMPLIFSVNVDSAEALEVFEKRYTKLGGTFLVES